VDAAAGVGQADHLLRRPFDHYARYRLAAEVVLATAGPTARVLDLGGGPGSLQAFLPGARVVATDIALPGAWHDRAPSLVVADGARLPFADDAFDVVVTLDTLEHVVPASRPPFLDEVARVAGGWALVVCPFATPGVADADAALREYVRNRFAPDQPTIAVLDEHLGYGHPDLDAARARLGAAGPVAVLPSGRLDRWFAGMLAFFHLLAIGDDEPVEVVQRFLNRNLYAADLAEPAYRHGLLVRTTADGPDPADVLRPLLDRAAEDPHRHADLSLLQVVLAESLVGSAAGAHAQARAAGAARAEAEAALAAAEAARAAAEARADALGSRLRALEAALADVRAAHDELAGFRDRVLGNPAVRAARRARGLVDRVRAEGGGQRP
jgi:hypothetical protein